jgi:hypothetical protein
MAQITPMTRESFDAAHIMWPLAAQCGQVDQPAVMDRWAAEIPCSCSEAASMQPLQCCFGAVPSKLGHKS